MASSYPFVLLQGQANASSCHQSVRPQEDPNTHLCNSTVEPGDQLSAGAPKSPEKEKPARIFHVFIYRKPILVKPA